MSAALEAGKSTHAEAKRHCRYRIEDADRLRRLGRITDAERDRRVASAWADLEAEFPVPPPL